MAPLAARTEYNWYINIKGNHFCHIRMYNGTWYIWPCWRIQQELYNKVELKDILIENIFYCTKCSHKDGCIPRINITLFGNEVMNICKAHSFALRNPEAKTIEIIKEILLASKTE